MTERTFKKASELTLRDMVRAKLSPAELDGINADDPAAFSVIVKILRALQTGGPPITEDLTLVELRDMSAILMEFFRGQENIGGGPGDLYGQPEVPAGPPPVHQPADVLRGVGDGVE